MVPGVIAERVPGRGHPLDQLRMPAGALPHHEERGLGAIALQEVEQRRRVLRMGAVVEGQGDRRLGRRDADNGAQREGALREDALDRGLEKRQGARGRGAFYEGVTGGFHGGSFSGWSEAVDLFSPLPFLGPLDPRLRLHAAKSGNFPNLQSRIIFELGEGVIPFLPMSGL